MGTSARYDVAIIGAGPAGSTAAALLAKTGRQVVLVDKDEHPRTGHTAAWLNALTTPLLADVGLPVKQQLKHGFGDVRFFSADLSKTAVPAFLETPAYLIELNAFRTALVDAAVKAGATFHSQCPVTRIRLGETSVVIETEAQGALSARLLLFACGQNSALFDDLGMLHPPHHDTTWTGQVSAEQPKRSSRQAPAVGVVLGLDGGHSFCLYMLTRHRVSVAVNWVGERGGAAPALAQACAGLAAQGVLPVDLSREALKIALVSSPASGALDMESHVAKHTLVIGDAGGFVSAASNEGIYPAMWSARIACDVADAALTGTCSQDDLMVFDTTWRIAMADYLRPPNTDIQFLLPLIFSNQPMADRMGAAFFSGENI